MGSVKFTMRAGRESGCPWGWQSLVVLAMIVGAGWMAGFQGVSRAQFGTEAEQSTDQPRVGQPQHISNAKIPDEIHIWIVVFERIGYPVVVAAFLALSLFLGGQAHIKIMRESLAEIVSALEDVRGTIEDLREETDASLEGLKNEVKYRNISPM